MTKLSDNNIFSCHAEDEVVTIQTVINLKSTNAFIVSEDIDVLLITLAPDDREICF